MYAVADAQSGERGGRSVRVWQRMPSVPARLRSTQIAIEVPVYRARNVRGQVVALTRRRVFQVEPTVGNERRGGVQAVSKGVGLDERRDGHVESLLFKPASVEFCSILHPLLQLNSAHSLPKICGA